MLRHVLGRPNAQSEEITFPSGYLLIPVRLASDLCDNPLAVGIYGLIARLYFRSGQPIPLSAADIMRLDPSLSRGAVLCALHRLERGGWITSAEDTGRKTLYTPTWGLVSSHPRPWQMTCSRLGRPAHVHVRRVDRRIFDLCIGQLDPHPQRAAFVARYTTRALIGLRDAGLWMLGLCGRPVTSPALAQLQLDPEQSPVLPADEVLLARAMQTQEPESQPLALTTLGQRRMVSEPVASIESANIPQTMILPMIPMGITEGITQGIAEGIESTTPAQQPVQAAQCEQTQTEAETKRDPWHAWSQDHGESHGADAPQLGHKAKTIQTNTLDSNAITEQARKEYRQRIGRIHWSLIDTLQMRIGGGAFHISCSNREQIPFVQEKLVPITRGVLRALGITAPLRIVALVATGRASQVTG